MSSFNEIMPKRFQIKDSSGTVLQESNDPTIVNSTWEKKNSTFTDGTKLVDVQTGQVMQTKGESEETES